MTGAPPPVIRVAILEDDAPARKFYANLFVKEPGFELAFAAANVAEAHAAMLGTKVDVALVDIRLKDGSGLDLLLAGLTADSELPRR